eukprot:TRINITY_DN123_c0_g4_i2.p1 TRINITY_DN123_c0_g4~~TRINITY_DN123_c0_g4_i2.p1  ORF type:complete len:289 (+),score=63.69 TRINITY_DN123_c0_g4_i2:48-914(+)
MDKAIGQLRITVVKAQGLGRTTEINEGTVVCVQYYESRASTQALPKTSAEVEWNQELVLDIAKPFGMLEISIIGTKSNGRLGYVSIPIVTIGDLKEYPGDWYPLGAKESGDQVSGELMLGFQLEIASEDWAAAHKGAHAFLTGNLVPANRLLQQALNSAALKPYLSDLNKLHAFLFLENKQYEEAIVYAQASVDERADDAEAFYYLGLSYYNLNDHVSALKYFERGNQLDPKHPQLKYNKEMLTRQAATIEIGKLLDDAVKVFVKKETDSALSLVLRAQELNPVEETG